jgi:OOP family OmpA-OmpF porin
MTYASIRAAAMSALVASVAWGQTNTSLPRIDLETLELDPAALGSLIVGNGQSLEPGSYRAGFGLEYERAPLVLDVNGQRVGEVVTNRLTAYLFGAYGLLPDLELDAEIPLIAFQNGDDLASEGLPAVSTGGVGTAWIAARYQLLSTWNAPVDLAAYVGLGLPIGTVSALGNEGFAVEPRVMASHTFGEFLVSGQVAGLLRGSATVGDKEIGSQLGAAASLGWLAVAYRPELTARLTVPFRDFPPSVEVLAGTRYPLTSHIEAFGFIGPAFGTLPGTPAFRAMLGVAMREEPARPVPAPAPEAVPPPAVAVPPAPPVDPCALGHIHTPAQCPDLDDDGDGIRNADDKCPLEKGVADYAGCPIPDRDKDGVPDAEDRCPDEPGPKERQGCPFHDRDNDGIEDSVDACPDEPGPPETRGCPIKDTDGDGVPDHLDNCPNEPGPASNQGCPVKQKQLVIITKESLKIRDAVYFDTAKATIQKRSFELLNQVAAVINSHPGIPLIRIEGHTDSTGNADANRRLSESRANAVRQYLMAKSVAPDRLEGRGYGPDRPIAPNTTSKGRALNRRVEFNIVDLSEPPPTSGPSGDTNQ